MSNSTYTATTSHETALRVDRVSRNLIHIQDGAREDPLALVHIPGKSRSAFILFDNPDLLPLSVLDRRSSGPIIPLRWRSMPPDRFAFFDPGFESDLVALCDASEHSVGTLSFTAPEVHQGNRFKLTAAPDRSLTASVQHQIHLVQLVVASSPISILDILRDLNLTDRSVIASLLSETLLPSEIEVFVDFLFEDRERVKTFASLFQHDPWAARGLPSLFDFIRRRHAKERTRPILGKFGSDTGQDATGTTLIGPDLDGLALAALPGEPIAFAHRCTATARSKIASIRDFCLVTTARNDGLYILDWLAHHQAIGVDRVFLYTNDNQDGSDELLRVLAKAGEISLIESNLSLDGVSPVSKAYGHALSMLPEVLDYRWCAIIDSDEYIGIDKDKFSNIKDFVAWQELKHVDVIVLNWIVFGSSGALRWKEQPISIRFQERYLEGHVKSIFRPRYFHHAMPHFPYTRLTRSITSRDAEGNPHQSFAAHSTEPRDGPAWIAHYFFRSLEEFLWKFSRGRGDQPLLAALQQAAVPDGFMGSFIAQQSELRLVMDSRVLAFGSETTSQLKRLRAIPGVREALEVINQHYREKSGTLETTLRALRSSATPIQSAFYDLFLCGDKR